jgi:cyclic pyranopterin phosphate synthase
VRDRLDRPLRDLRVSVTDRCNLRCRYCMPREVFGPGFRFLAREQLLSFEEIARLAAIFARLGVRKIRLTGGEPLLRDGIEQLVGLLARTAGLDELAMTTNGLLLARKARALAAAGLDRVTVSLDALEDEVLAEINDAPISAERVLAGIDAAIEAGLNPVKVNMMVRADCNEGCVVSMAEHFRHRRVALRFIEYMDVGSSNGWRGEQVVEGSEILDRVRSRWPLEPLAPAGEDQVASRYRYRDGAGEIGVIQSVSEPFCASCTRARLSADGKLYTCLFAHGGTDLREPLRAGASDAELEHIVRAVWSGRVDRYSAERARVRARTDEPAKVEMSYIGG